MFGILFLALADKSEVLRSAEEAEKSLPGERATVADDVIDFMLDSSNGATSTEKTFNAAEKNVAAVTLRRAEWQIHSALMKIYSESRLQISV